MAQSTPSDGVRQLQRYVEDRPWAASWVMLLLAFVLVARVARAALYENIGMGKLFLVSGFVGAFAWILVLNVAIDLRRRAGGTATNIPGYVAGRVSPRSLVASLAYWVLSAQLACAYVGWTIPWIDREALREIIPVEFFVLHGTLFFGLPILIRTSTPKGHFIKGVIVLLLFSLYLAIAFQNLSPGAAWIFVALALVKLVAPTIRPPSGRALPGFVLRWLVGLGAFMGWALLFEDTSLRGYDTIPMGALYFATLASAELMAVYEAEDELHIE